MRIDPKGTIGGKPALLVRDCLRTLRARISWDLAAMETAASLEPGTGKLLLRVIGRGTGEERRAGLVGDHLRGTTIVVGYRGQTCYAKVCRESAA